MIIDLNLPSSEMGTLMNAAMADDNSSQMSTMGSMGSFAQISAEEEDVFSSSNVMMGNALF